MIKLLPRPMPASWRMGFMAQVGFPDPLLANPPGLSDDVSGLARSFHGDRMPGARRTARRSCRCGPQVCVTAGVLLRRGAG